MRQCPHREDRGKRGRDHHGGWLHASPRSEMVTETRSSGSTPVIVFHAPGVVEDGITWTFSEPTRTDTTEPSSGIPSSNITIRWGMIAEPKSG